MAGEKTVEKFCMYCGSPIQPMDRECGSCGQTLPAGVDQWLSDDVPASDQGWRMPAAEWRPEYGTGAAVFRWREVLSQSWKVVSDRTAVKSFVAVGVVWVCVAVLLVYLRLLWQDFILPGFSSSLFNFMSGAEVTAVSLSITVGLYVVEYSVQGLLGVVVIWLAYDVLTGGSASVASGFRAVLRRVGPLLVGELVFLLPSLLMLLSAALVLGDPFMVGLPFFFTPLIVFGPLGTIIVFIASLGLYVYEPVLVIEDKGLIAAFRRSWYYASRNWGNIFWLFIILALVGGLPTFAFTFAISPLYYPVQYDLIVQIINPLVGILLKIVVAVVFMHLRVLKGVYT